MINGRDAKLLCLILLIVLGQKKVNTLKDQFFGLVNNTANATFS